MITGEYTFYQDGVEIGKFKNLITTYGKKYLTSFLAGFNQSASKDIALGIDSTTALASNTRLGFEFYKLPVTLASIDTSSGYSIVYKTVIPQDVAGIISEIGLYPGERKSTNNYDSKFISDFKTSTDWYTSINTNPYRD